MLDAAAGASQLRQAVAGPTRRVGVRVAAALAAGLALASVAGFLLSERQQALESATALSVRRAGRLAEEVGDALALAQVAVARIEARLDELPPGASPVAALVAAAAEQGPLLAALPLPFRMVALGADGRPLVDTAAAPGRRAVALLHLARPNRQGVAAFTVELDHAALLKRLEATRLPVGGGVALFRLEADGSTTLLAGAPHDATEPGQRVRGPLAAALARSPQGTFNDLTPLDAARRIVAYRRLDGEAASLVVAFDMAADAVLATWRSRLPWAAGTVLLLLAVIGAGWRRLERAQRAQSRQETALRRSESHFRALAANLPDVVVRLDRNGRHLYANPAVQQATGLGPEAFIGKTNADLGMPAENVAQWMATLDRVFRDGRAQRTEFAFPGPLGLRHWESVVALEPPVPGEPPTALVISRDISERKQAEAARETLNRRVAEVLESMSDGFVSLDRDWRFVAVNRKAGELLRRDPAGLIGRQVWTEFPEALGQPFHRAYERAMNDDATVVLEAHFPPWDRWFENRIHPTADGISIFFTDITERRRAADALRDSEARYRELFEANPHPMWVYDLASLGFLAVNDAAVRQYGYTRSEFLQMTIKDIRPAGDVPSLLANMAVPRDGFVETGLWRHRIKDGRLLEVEITSHTLRFEGRDARLVLAHDVTRRSQAERTLRDNEQRLRLALQAANQGLFDLDLRSGDAVVSPEYARMLGWEPADFHESNALWRDRLHPDDRDAAYRAFEDYLAGRRSDYRVEFRQRMRDGGWKWILSLGRVQERDAEGRPLRMLGTHTDLDAIKAAQAAQIAATQRFEKLFQAAPEAISVTEFDGGRFLQVNDAFCELFGHSREQLAGRTAIELGMWLTSRGRDAVVAQLRAGEAVRGFEGVARRRSGEAIDVLFSAERIDFDGHDGLLLMYRDISQRKRLEAALRASEQRFRLASSFGQVWEWDFSAGGVAPANELFGSLGYGDVAAGNQLALFNRVVPADDLQQVKESLVRHLKRQGPYHVQFRATDSSGRVRWFETQGQALWDDSGRATYMAGTTFEITERREAEEQVRRLAAVLEQRVQERTAQLVQSEARYRTIFETVPVSIGEEDWSGVQQLLRGLRAQGVSDGPGHFAARPDFVHECLRAVKVRRLNRKALALHDVGDAPHGAPDLQMFYPAPAHEAQFIGELEALWAGQRLFSAKRSLPSVTGRPLNLMLTMSLPGLDDDDGTALVCLVDITEIDRLNAELDRSVERLRKVNRELETFTYSVSHDLKAPLRGIDGYSRLLLSDHLEQLDEEGRQFLHHIRQATQHMGVLIDDLLTYSRLERRDQTITPLPLADVVQTALKGLRQDLSAAGVQVEVNVDPGVRVRADAQGLTMALRNLIDNAVKFSRASAPPRLSIEVTRSKDGVRLSVRDNGVGFDMKFHDRIFSIFQRLHRAEDYPGTGIGLAIVRKAMERMGGHVWAFSRVGEGATFTLELPEADPA